MASMFGFRQHIILILVMDILVLLFIPSLFPDALGNDNNILVHFIANNVLNEESGLLRTMLVVFVTISAIGVTSASNFGGVTGVLSSFFGTSVEVGKKVVTSAILVGTIGNYTTIGAFLLVGSISPIFQIIYLIIFPILIVDALFSSLDWVRGVIT